MAPTGERRRRARRRGRRAETLGAWFLRLQGYRILARGHRTPVGEIDLIARRGRRIAFVEVKARASREQAAESLGARQRRRIVRAAHYWLAGRADATGLDLSFDLILIAPRRLPRHLRDAWREDG